MVASVGRFQNSLADLSQILFVTDDEVTQLMGEDVHDAIIELDGHGMKERFCAICDGLCCRDIGCELYAASFHKCPVHSFRPLACRFHFCHRFGSVYEADITALKDLYLACYMLRDCQDSFKLRCLDAPPLAQLSPELATQARSLVASIAQGAVDAGVTIQSLERLVRQFRKAGCGASAP